MSDPSAVAAYRNALAVAGIAGVTIQRATGFAPNVVIGASASVQAVVKRVTADGNAAAQSGLSASTMGQIGQNDRMVIVLADDLAAQNFPLPIVNGDQCVLPDSSEVLYVTRVDAYKRRLAGALELTVAGVS